MFKKDAAWMNGKTWVTYSFATKQPWVLELQDTANWHGCVKTKVNEDEFGTNKTSIVYSVFYIPICHLLS